MHHVIVVGGGPAGMSAALMLGRCLRRVLLIDDNKPRNARSRGIRGLLGHDGLLPRQFGSMARDEVQKYGVELLRDTVVDAQALPSSPEQPHRTAFAVCTERGERFECRKLVIATGMRDKLPEIEGILDCYGISVHHCPYCDAWEHRGQHITVVSPSAHSATGLALALRLWSKNVTVLGNELPIEDFERQRQQLNGIGWRSERVARLVHDRGVMKGVQFANGETLPAEALFFSTGQYEQSDVSRKLGCVYTENERVHTTSKQRTNIPGVFYAGDADDDVQFVAVAGAEGLKAAVAINRELLEEDIVRP